MVFQFGDIKFDVLNAPTSFRVRESRNFVPVERLKNKPVVQELGIPLIEIDMTIELRYQYSDVLSTITALRTALLTSKEQELIDGSGYSYGTFKIREMDRDILKTDDKGRVLSAEISLSFLEFAPYDQEQGERVAARQKAFALISVKPIEVKKRDLYVTPQAKSAVNVSRIAYNAKAASDNVKKAAAIPTLAFKYTQTAKRQLETAQRAVQDARTELNNVTSAVSNLAQLKAIVENVGNTMGSILPELTDITPGEIPGLVAGSVTTLDTQLSAMTSAATIITGITAIRR